MSPELTQLIDSLSAEEQESVLHLVEFLKKREPGEQSTCMSAVDEFVRQHPELLRRLAS